MSAANRLGAFALLLYDALEHSLGDLSPSAAALLLTCHYRPGLTTSELAIVADISQPTAVRVLAGLTRRGYVDRGQRTGRVSPIFLSAMGHDAARAIQTRRLSAMEQLLGGLHRDQHPEFEKMMGQILAGATTSRAFARVTCRLCDHPACNEPECPLGAKASSLERAALEKE